MRSYRKGRQAILSAIRKSKYQQILQNVITSLVNNNLDKILILGCLISQDLEARNMKKTVQLGMAYHIPDIIGADLVSW